MRMACSSTPEGNVYRFYSTDTNTCLALKPVVPFLLASHAEIVVGKEDGHPNLLLRVGPIGGDAEAALLRLLGGSLTELCVVTAH
jgi:hypothetical protein